MSKIDIKNILSEENQEYLINFLECYDEEITENIFEMLMELTGKIVGLKLCKVMLEDNRCVDQVIRRFTDIIDRNPEVCEQEEAKKSITDILEKVRYTNIGENSLMRIIDILESVYAFGNKTYTQQIIQLYKKIEPIRIDLYNANAIRAKLAILAYGANKYNADRNLRELCEIHTRVRKGRFGHLRGMVYYYHYIFYERTECTERYIFTKCKYEYMNIRDLCLKKAQEYEFYFSKDL